ncbi:MAG: uroporphyrinogen-III synthase [Lysobacter sp.]|nr:uroporphyrinogen-III synthase [Lysobacter sp.]
MTRSSTPAQPLAGWYVISLRPRDGHAALRRAASAHGAKVLALSPWRIQPLDDAATRAALDVAIAADTVIATSPSAVRAAAALRPLKTHGAQHFIAVGEGTAAALRRAGIAQIETPTRMDSEGVLALSVLQHVNGRDIGLITAPGGRDRIEPALRERGARVLRADVYRRVPIELSPRAVRALLKLATPAAIALSSGEAFVRILDALPANAADVLRRCRIIAASQRLADLARERGFDDIVVAASARPRDLIAAAAAGAVNH